MGSHENMIVPIGMFIGFQERDRLDSQNLNNDSFYRLPVTSAQRITGTEKNPDASIFFKL